MWEGKGGQRRAGEGKGRFRRRRRGREGEMHDDYISDNTRASDKALGVTHVPPGRSATTPRRGMETHLEAGFQMAHMLSTPVVTASETLHGCPQAPAVP